MKGFFSFLAAIAGLLTAWVVADGGLAFIRENYHKYITLKKCEGPEA